ncbi:MAG: hypothetical protein M1404_01740 [Acidobacteria bacterium]|nr:hypothetical protein [Acidobacteriota bacterium]
MATFAQWVHVSAAVVGVGGMGFMLFVLFPSVGVLNDEQRDLLMKFVLGRFRWVTWSVIFLLLASGLYNVRLVWFVPWGPYWKFLSIKIVLALVVFAIVLLLTIPLGILRKFRERRQLWLSVAFALAMVVILISAYLRRGG